MLIDDDAPARPSTRHPATREPQRWCVMALAALLFAGCGDDKPSDGPDTAESDTAGDTGSVGDGGGGTDAIDPGDGVDGDATDDAAIHDTDSGVSDTGSGDTGSGDTGSGDTGSGDTGSGDGDAGGVKEKCNGIDDDKDGQTDEEACDDGQPCTEDFCDKIQKFCSFSPISDGGTCDDGNACTTKDSCSKGACVGSGAKDCGDGDPCTGDVCNPATGGCDNPARAAGATCDDANACTEGDTCDAGVCKGKAAVCNDNNPCTVDACDMAKGCTYTGDEGKPCDDGDLCTQGDACGGANCLGKPLACESKDDCQLAACDPKVGTCVKSNKPDGAACADDSLCTQDDACQGGKCTPAKTITCPPGKACLDNACDPLSGLCLGKLAPDGSPCDDGDPCTKTETCKGGNCSFVGSKCDDGNPCTADGCQPGVGCQNTALAGACDDGDLCTDGDGCVDGKCVSGKAKDCNDSTDCSVDSCDGATGKCVNDGSAAEGKPCNDDGSACTTGETCAGGKCLGGTSKTCKDDDPCTADGCDPKTGVCAFPPAAAGTACSDGSICTFGDACDKEGKCTGKSIDCDDKSPCTTDSCDPKAGACSFVKKGTGDACEDGDLCTSGDACDASGSCKSGKVTACDDANACTDDKCDPTSGKCAFSPNSKSCDDGSICTAGESCIDGACKSGIDGQTVFVAGSGGSGFQDGSVNSAVFYQPRAIDIAASGVVVIADQANHRIRVIEGSNVKTLAGISSTGLVDGAPGTGRFSSPAGVAFVPSTGEVVVGDRNNHAIRLVSPTGTVTTLAGTTSAGLVDGKGAAARFYYPEGVDVDGSGFIYVADRYNHAIRRVTLDGIVTTLAGINSAGFLDGKGAAARFYYPADVAVDSKGTVFVADVSNYRIRAVLQDGTVSTVAGAVGGFADGTGAAAMFNGPEGIAVSPAGYLLVADRNNHRLRKVTKQGVVTTFSGNGQAGYTEGPALEARFNAPAGIAVDAKGQGWITDQGNQRIRRTAIGETLCLDEKPCTIDACDAKTGCTHAPQQEGKPCAEDGSCLTGGICDAAGTCKNQVAKCQKATDCTLASCDPVSGACSFAPIGKTCDDGDPCTTGEACENGSCLATIWSTTTIAGNGSSTHLDGVGTSTSFSYPRGGDVDASGTLYIADSNTHRIRRIAGNAVTTLAGSGQSAFADGGGAQAAFYYPCDVAVSSAGWLAVADRSNNRIRRVNVGDGSTTTLAGNGQATFLDGKGAAAAFNNPEGVAIDGKDNVFVADSNNYRIRRLEPDGTVTTIAGSGNGGFQDGPALQAWLYRPTDVAVLADGDVLICDYQNHRIRKLSGGQVTTLAGNGSATFVEGVGTGASFYYPQALALTPTGQLLVADRNNHRIRSVDPKTGKTTTVAGSSAGYQDGPASASKFNTPFGLAAKGNKIWVMDTQSYRIRLIQGPEKDCDDGDTCTTDACDAKTGKCLHTKDPQCCSPLVLREKFTADTDVSAYAFSACEASKTSVEPTKCEAASGVAPQFGWQVAPTLTTAWSSPGALYYGDITSETYDFGPSGGKVLTPKWKVPAKGDKLTFRVFFDTEPQAVFDRLYAFLLVDGKRVDVGSKDAPNYGAAWYKGSPGNDVAKTWMLVEIDVSAYSGKDVQVELTFNTGDGLKNTGLGVVIDDLTLLQTCPAP